MRSGRSFLFLSVVAAGLGAYIYFVEADRDPVPTTTSTREKVFTIETGTIEAVEITNASAETTRVVRTDTVWAMTDPEAAEADTVEVSMVVSSIESLERVRIVDENPASAAPFGLDPARIIVSVTVRGEAAPKRLLIGNKTPTGGDLYAKVDDDPKVFLIGAYLENTFNRKPFDLREKSVLKFTRDAVDTLVLAEGTSRMSFARTGNEWRLAAPVSARADFSAVDGIVGRLFQARMSRLVTTDGTGSLREYGLDRPQIVVTLGAGSTKAELAIGAKEGDEHVYARDLSRPLVFTVEKILLDELKRKPDDLRVKDLFEFRSFSAVGLDITSAGQTLSFAKAKGEGENAAETWSQTTPSAKAVDEAKFSDMLITLSNLRAESFAATALASGETVVVTARFGGPAAPRSEQITLRKSGTTVHAIRAGEPGAAVVSTTDFDRVMTLLKEITDTTGGQ